CAAFVGTEPYKSGISVHCATTFWGQRRTSFSRNPHSGAVARSLHHAVLEVLHVVAGVVVNVPRPPGRGCEFAGVVLRSGGRLVVPDDSSARAARHGTRACAGRTGRKPGAG